MLGNPAQAQLSQAVSQAAAPLASAKAPTVAPGQAALQQAAQLLRQGLAPEAVAVLRLLVNSNAPPIRAQSRYLLAIALDATGAPAEGLKALEGTLTDTTPLGQAIGTLRGQLLLQAAELALNTGAPEQATPYLQDYERLSVQPAKARFQRLNETLSPTPAQTAAAPFKVGVLLPQSGPLAAVGADLLRGLQLGLPTFSAAGRKLELVVRDTPSPAAARNAATELRAQGITLVIGPLLANQVAAVREALGGVPLLSFSSDGAVLGPQTHTLNFLPAQQAAQVATAAIGQGKPRVAALVPQGSYGEATLNGLRQALEQGGGTLVKSSFYNPQDTDIGSSIRELGKGFEALFVPAAARNLPLIAAQLAYYDLDRGVQLLGTGLWQDGARQSPLLAPSANGLRGSLFVGPTPPPGFAEKFEQTYGAAPHPLAGLGYDAAALLAQVANEQARTGNAPAQILLRPEGFYAPGGYVRFVPTGQTERGLALQAIGQGQFETRRSSLSLAPLPLPNPLLPSVTGNAAWW